MAVTAGTQFTKHLTTILTIMSNVCENLKKSKKPKNLNFELFFHVLVFLILTPENLEQPLSPG